MDKQLLSMLVCPICKGKLKYAKDTQELICTFDGLGYPIRDGVPVMLDSEARRLSEDEKLALAKEAKQEPTA
ncbi:tetraacyldisaccharide 4'-kinase [Bacterioplanes sanyensis]|uniref:UPF0434 protein CHH28_15440 n=1 Tax=Bacterioplanes sanyensis TaxID=1249553 RepID=A0A222FMI0_9GAMM|nr:Trm112 family protein [Bacterioplanes sanyensis]ASP39980.1 tetraacyldisaccharide 4'-kinase [Bacterioplanes sanyensis]